MIQLLNNDIERVASECRDNWKAPTIPIKQSAYTIPEIQQFRNHGKGEHFRAFIRCIRETGLNVGTLLDVGASEGYYSEVLRIVGFHNLKYRALDSSRAFAESARQRYPGIAYDIGDACALPYEDASFDIALSAACLMHIYNWRKALAELRRVSSKFVILHRTPIRSGNDETYWQSNAYGQRVLEIHFGESGLLKACADAGLMLLYQTDVFWNRREMSGHRSYLFSK